MVKWVAMVVQSLFGVLTNWYTGILIAAQTWGFKGGGDGAQPLTTLADGTCSLVI